MKLEDYRISYLDKNLIKHIGLKDKTLCSNTDSTVAMLYVYLTLKQIIRFPEDYPILCKKCLTILPTELKTKLYMAYVVNKLKNK